MCRFRQEVVIHDQDITEIKRWKVRIRQRRVGPNDFDRARNCFKVHQHGKRAGVIYDLRFKLPRAPKLIIFSSSVSSKRRPSHKIENSGYGAMECWDITQEIGKLLSGFKSRCASPGHRGRSHSCGVELFVAGARPAQWWVEQNER